MELKVIVNCPCCYSGNHFSLNKNKLGNNLIVCEDCGFPLVENFQFSFDISRCLICNCDRFSKVRNLNPFQKQKLQCYLCEAIYEGFDFSNFDDKFDPETEKSIKASYESTSLQGRVVKYSS